jgi:hypothetical protein
LGIVILSTGGLAEQGREQHCTDGKYTNALPDTHNTLLKLDNRHPCSQS